MRSAPPPPPTPSPHSRAAESSVAETALLHDLAVCAVMFLAADPPRTSQMAFVYPDGTLPAEAAQRLTVARPHGSGARRREVAATVLPLTRALPVLGEVRRIPGADPTAVFWGAAAVVALQLLARGRLLPAITPAGFDTWRIGPCDAQDVERLRELAAAMPPQARAIPAAGKRLGLPQAEPLARAFLDAVADVLARTPAGPAAAGGPAWTAVEPQTVPQYRQWADDVAAGLTSSTGLSLRIELPEGDGGFGDGEAVGASLEEGQADAGEAVGGVRAVVQMHHTIEGVVCDAQDVWVGASAAAGVFGPSGRAQALRALRRAVHVWPPLGRLLRAAAPVELELSGTEVSELLGEAAPALAAAGIQVHWPKELARTLLARAVIEPAGNTDSDLPSLLSAEALLSFQWQLTLGGGELSSAELDRIAEAQRPLVRLRDQWVLIDPQILARARDRANRTLTPVQALAAALSGSTVVDGERVDVTTRGWIADLRERLADPEASARRQPVPQPAQLRATLRGYQLRGLTWLDQMTSLGLGGCLADDMGLGKTITLIALHLHRQATPATAGPTLVVCPTSLLGNWQQEIEKFAPGTPVIRYHGTQRTLDSATEGFVLTTYATLRLRTAPLAEHSWALMVADEAQHVKNPHAATAEALRTLRTRAKVALTGTPIENNLSELWALLDWTTPGLLGTLEILPRPLRPGRGERKGPPRRAAPGHLDRPVPPAAQEVRPGHRPRIAAQNRDQPPRNPHQGTSRPLRGCRPRDDGRHPRQRRHRPQGPGPQTPDRPEADHQPPRAVPA